MNQQFINILYYCNIFKSRFMYAVCVVFYGPKINSYNNDITSWLHFFCPEKKKKNQQYQSSYYDRVLKI